jgi:hypothetical protein
MTDNHSLTIEQPLPDPRSRWRRFVDRLLRRPTPEPGNLLIYFPNVEVTDTFLVAPDEVAVEFTAKPAKPLGPEWVDLGYLTDDGITNVDEGGES